MSHRPSLSAPAHSVALQEEETDRLQPGGPNPRINEEPHPGGAQAVDNSSVRFDFTTGRLPRHTSIRGDAQHCQQEGGSQYLRLLPGSAVMITTAALPQVFVHNCGGGRLNQVRQN